MNRFIFASISLLFFLVSLSYGQEDQYEDLLTEKVVNLNPVYKPMLSFGTGVLNFYGDVRNNYSSPINGNFGFSFNVATFVDRQRFLKLNLFFLYGEISGNERSVSDLQRNLNFNTDMVDFGMNFEYAFGHLIKRPVFIRPYISVGIENLQFSPKGDLYNQDGQTYYYWTDGSIRDIPQAMSDVSVSSILNRDFRYETDLRKWERDNFSLGSYSQNSFSIPLSVGINYIISDRVTCKLGSTLHYTFSDFIDNVSSSGTSVTGKKGNDMFLYNYFSIEFDLFSEPKTMIVEKMFAELDFDAVMYDDEDGDFILDAADECPGTPYGVAVDSLGCPLDQDNDGVPDYLDKDNFTPAGAWVDDEGRAVSEEEYLQRLLMRNDAMNRSDVLAYFETIGKGYVRKSVTEIPDKFKSLDTDQDEYISFDELLQAIDDYFDRKLDLTVEDIYELNNFFFGQ